MTLDGRVLSRATRQQMDISGTRFQQRASIVGRRALAHGQPQERSASRQSGKRQGDWLPALQALQPGWTFDRMRQRSPRRKGVPDHRRERGRALAGGIGGRNQPQSGLFPSPVQSYNWADTEGTYRRRPSEEGARRIGLRPSTQTG